jgi:hypothetical protein
MSSSTWVDSYDFSAFGTHKNIVRELTEVLENRQGVRFYSSHQFKKCIPSMPEDLLGLFLKLLPDLEGIALELGSGSGIFSHFASIWMEAYGIEKRMELVDYATQTGHMLGTNGNKNPDFIYGRFTPTGFESNNGARVITNAAQNASLFYGFPWPNNFKPITNLFLTVAPIESRLVLNLSSTFNMYGHQIDLERRCQGLSFDYSQAPYLIMQKTERFSVN